MNEIIALILLVSYREVGILCDRTSWDWKKFQKIFWETDQDNFWTKNFDWYHVSNGLATLIICHILAENIQVIDLNFMGEFQVITLTVFYWLVWMYLRNVVLHIIIPLPRYRRYWYFIPLIGAYLDYKLRKD